MKKKIVIKRKTTHKHVFPQDKPVFLVLKADFLSKASNRKGTLNNHLPKNLEEQTQLAQLKKNYYAEFITPKKNRSDENEIIRNYFQKTAFLKLLFKWAILYIEDSAKKTLGKISTELAKTHQNINSAQIKTEKEDDLKAILEVYAPKLIYSPRKSRWWEDQISRGKSKFINK